MMKNPILLLLWLAGGKIRCVNVAAFTIQKFQWLSRIAHDNPSLFERRNIHRQQSERQQNKDPSRLYSTSTNVNNVNASKVAAPASISSDTEFRGLLPTSEFRRRQALHKILRLLQKQLPVLLTRPLSERDAFETYTDDTKLIIKVDGSDAIELVNSREELVSILEAVVLTITVASSTAESFFFNLASVTTPPSKDEGQSKIDPSTPKKNVVECQILIEPEHFLRIVSDSTDDLTIEVDWEVNLISVLPGIGSSTLGSTSKKVGTEQGYSPSSARTGSRSFNVTRPSVASAKSSPSSDAKSQNTSKPQSSTSSSQRQIRGISILTLESKSDYKVSCHQIVNILWNEVDVDRAAIGQTLLILRQATQLVSEQAAAVAPIPFLSQATNIWNQVKDEVIARQKTTTASMNEAEYMAPILITKRPAPTKLQKDGKSFSNAADESETTTRIPINEFILPKPNESNINALYVSLPCHLPGSEGWSDYAAVYQVSRNFVQFAIPTLSGGRSLNDEPVLYESSLFAPTAQLVASDGNELLRGAKRLDNFYQSLVSLRKISNGKWLLNNVSVVDYYFDSDDFSLDRKANVMLEVDYSTLLHVPTAGAIVGSLNSGYDISIEGTDLFVVSFYLSAQERDDIEVNDRDIDLVPSFISSLRIERVEQKKLSLDNGSFGDAFTIKSNPQDNVWFMKNLVAAVESGSLRSIDSSTSFLLDMVSRLTNRASSSNKIEQRPRRSNREIPGTSFLNKKSTPRRSDESAVTVYRIMESLHADLPTLMDPSTIASRGRQVPPANDYLDDDIQLLGYLDEVLLRGRLQYSQSIGMLINALHTALRSGSVVSEKDPVVIVELTSRGNIRLSFSIFLKLSRLAIGPFSDSTVGNALVDVAADRLSPLHIRLVAEYILNQDTGLIDKHRLLESRVNGQLTPADVVSRWIQRIRSGFSPSSRIQDDEIGVDAPWVRNLVLDTVNWMLSINK